MLADSDDHAHAVIEHYVESSPAATGVRPCSVSPPPRSCRTTAHDLLTVLPIPPDEPVRVEVLGTWHRYREEVSSWTIPTGVVRTFTR